MIRFTVKTEFLPWRKSFFKGGPFSHTHGLIPEPSSGRLYLLYGRAGQNCLHAYTIPPWWLGSGCLQVWGYLTSLGQHVCLHGSLLPKTESVRQVKMGVRCRDPSFLSFSPLLRLCLVDLVSSYHCTVLCGSGQVKCFSERLLAGSKETGAQMPMQLCQLTTGTL